MKICETERIVIREFVQDDTKAFIDMTADGSLWELFGDCSEAVDWMEKWIGDSKEITERDNPYEEYLAYAIVEKKTKDVIGSVGCSVYEDIHEIGIAYCIGSKYRGKGFAKEAASAYTKYFFEHYPNINRMIATIRQDNIISNSVIRSVGYELEMMKMYKDINDEEEAMYNFYVYDNKKAKDLTVPVGEGILNVRVGAIIAKEGKLLMVGNERSDYYYSVGGRIKFGESAEEAVIREVEEETGVRMEIDRLGFVHENFFVGDAETNRGKEIYEISFFFYMKVPDGFEPICNSFTEDEQKENLYWIDVNTEKKYYPEFLREHWGKEECGVKHIVTRDF